MTRPSRVLLGVAAWLIFNPLAAILGVGLGFFLPRLLVRHSRKRRLRKFNLQLVDALQSLANAFRAGLTFPQAVEQLAREMPAPLSQEFGLLIKEVKLGVSIEDALVVTSTESSDRTSSSAGELAKVYILITPSGCLTLNFNLR